MDIKLIQKILEDVFRPITPEDSAKRELRGVITTSPVSERCMYCYDQINKGQKFVRVGPLGGITCLGCLQELITMLQDVNNGH